MHATISAPWSSGSSLAEDASGPGRKAIDEVAARYRDLWRALTTDDGKPRRNEEIGSLADRVRDALDRRLTRLGETGACGFVANTFAIEECVHESEHIAVYRLRHRDLATLHALKTVRACRRDDEILRGLIVHEARLNMTVRHPRIVSVDGLLRLDDGRPALLMEWMAGGSLSRRIAAGASPDIDDIAVMMRALLEGVAVLHGHGIVHTDLVPGNLLFRSDAPASLKIADLGIAIGGSGDHASLGLKRAGMDRARPPREEDDLRDCGHILSMLMTDRADESPTGKALATLGARLRQAASPDIGEALAILDGGVGRE